MPRQQQVDDALRRAFEGRKPSGKVRAAVDGHTLVLFHYHHTLLRWDLQSQAPTFEWFDKPTDKRILNAALEALAADGRRLWGARRNGLSSAATPRQASNPSAIAAEERGVSLRTPQGRTTVTVVRGRESEEGGSRFLAVACFPVATRAAAEAALPLLRARGELSGATHRIGSFRASDGSEHQEDDGEDKAGAALLGALRGLRASGCAVVVARWYGGRNIGRARFRHVRERATELLGALPGGGGGPPRGPPTAAVAAPLSSSSSWPFPGAPNRLSNSALPRDGTDATAAASAASAADNGDKDESREAQQRHRRALAAAAAEARLRGGQEGVPHQHNAQNTAVTNNNTNSNIISNNNSSSNNNCIHDNNSNNNSNSSSNKRQRQHESTGGTGPCSSSSSFWTCSACTLINNRASEMCEACGGCQAMPPSQSPPSLPCSRGPAASGGEGKAARGRFDDEVIDLAGTSDDDDND